MRAKAYYYKDKDQAFLVSESQKKSIDLDIIHGRPVDTGGKTLYPILEDLTEVDIRAGKTKAIAWIIRNGQSPTARWYWQIQEHRKSHATCHPLGDGLCGFKMVRFYEWNASTSKWELCPMVNHADTLQEQVLDSK